MTTTPLTSVIGAEVHGVDTSRVIAYETCAAIRAALARHLVLVFRDQRVTPRSQIAFARRFGEIKPPPVRTKHGGPPELNVVSQDDPRGEGADNWHADNTYTAEPPMGSVLHVARLPPTGGDTMFASMYAAYDSLSGPLRRLCDRLTATHDVTASMRKAIARGHSDADLAEVQRALPPVTHPVAITHPDTGRKALFVNVNSTVRVNELTGPESDVLLRLLFEHVRTPDIQVRIRWDESTLVFVDNRAAQHYAVPDYRETRVLHRVAIVGGPLA